MSVMEQNNMKRNNMKCLKHQKYLPSKRSRDTVHPESRDKKVVTHE